MKVSGCLGCNKADGTGVNLRGAYSYCFGFCSLNAKILVFAEGSKFSIAIGFSAGLRFRVWGLRM